MKLGVCIFMTKKHVQVRLDKETYKKLQHYVVDHDSTMQEVLEKTIKKLVEGDKKNDYYKATNKVKNLHWNDT
jgi:hypothetical protein